MFWPSAVFGLLAAGALQSAGKPDNLRMIGLNVPHCPKGLSICTLDDIAFTPSKTVESESFMPAFDPRWQVRKAIRRATRTLDAALAATGLVQGSILGKVSLREKTTRLVERIAKKLKTRPSRSRQKRSMESLCDEFVTTFVPEVGQNKDGEWKYLGGKTSVTATYCRDNGGPSCGSRVSDSRCSQNFAEIPLPVFSNAQFKMDLIKVPCGCTCVINR